MDVSSPMNCVVPSAHGPVLAVLASTTTPLTGRGIAALCRPGVSQPQVARILRDLSASGLVDRIPAGSSSLFVLNREHVAAAAIEVLISLRQELWARIVEHTKRWTQTPVAVIVYGSTARGDGNLESDIDLLIVRPPLTSKDEPSWQDDVTDLAGRVERWTGNPCEVIDVSEAELERMASSGERLLAEVRRDGRAVVGSLDAIPLSHKAA